MTHNIGPPGGCSTNMACVCSYSSDPLPCQLWKILNIMPTCLLFAFLTTSGFCTSPTLQVHQLSFGFTLQPLRLGPLSSGVSLLSSPATSLETPRRLLWQWYPCQRRSVTPSLAICSCPGALTVHSIASVPATHSFISVPANTQHVEPYHIYYLSLFLLLDYSRWPGRSRGRTGQLSTNSYPLTSTSLCSIYLICLSPCQIPYISLSPSSWNLSLDCWRHIVHTLYFVSLTIIFCFLPNLHFFQHSPFHSTFSVYSSVISPPPPVSSSCTSVDDSQIFLILAYSVSLPGFQIFLEYFHIDEHSK